MTEKEETDAKQAPKKNLNQGHRSRMRKRYLTCGFSGFQEHEILELLLFYALPRVNTNPIAHQLLKEFHSLAGVLDADPVELQKIPGVREQAAVFLNMLPELFRYYQRAKKPNRKTANNWNLTECHSWQRTCSICTQACNGNKSLCCCWTTVCKSYRSVFCRRVL